MQSMMKFGIGIKSLMLLLVLVVFSTSCKKDNTEDDQDNGSGQGANSGKVEFLFDFAVDGNTLLFDTLLYKNAANNQYKIFDIQYFISNVTVYQNGKGNVLNKHGIQHYIDTDIQESMNWDLNDQLQPGKYDSLSFTFGFTDAENTSFMFTNPPESNMVWPGILGGGYHYMKINGKWENVQGNQQGFGIHLGRGQVYDASNNPISYIDNSFRVSLPNSDFEIVKDVDMSITVRMNVDQWFKNPVVYDFNTFGGMIMQNQNAMKTIANNGWNVFELRK